MAITCTGPPPLPPGKRFLQRASRKLTIGPTYRSFRDPSLEAWIPPGQRITTPRDDDDEDDVDVIDGFELVGIKVVGDELARPSRGTSSSNDQRTSLYHHSSLSASTSPSRCSTFMRSHSNNSSTRGGSNTGVDLLFRSRSEGNLIGKKKQQQQQQQRNTDATTSTTANNATTPLDRCIRAIYGSWRNLMQLGGMSRPSKAVTQAKKVAPPAVPNDFRHSGSSFGSAGYASSEDGFLQQQQQQQQLQQHQQIGNNPNGLNNSIGHNSMSGQQQQQQTANNINNGNGNSVVMPGHGVGGGGGGPTTVDDGSGNYGMPAGKSPGPMFTHPGFSFPSMVNKYAHAEDQGIDMTQSPGRDSPGSSGSGSGSRHSTASLDSGRASGYHLGSGPRSAGALTSSPRCSISSLGSSSHPDRPNDLDLVHAWLTELQFEEYFALFASAGYDLATITRMTPEDLTAIGIKKPNHRKQLKAEIDNLNVGDGLPEHIPTSLEEWLRHLRLEEYLGALHQQGMRSVDDVTTLTWEDLEDIGIVRLGHQKKLLLAIKRIKDIKAGKRIQPLDLAKLPPHPGHTQEVVIQRGVPDLPSPDEDCSSPILRSFQRPADCTPQHTANPGCATNNGNPITGGSASCNNSSSGGSTSSNTSVNSAVQQFGAASWRSMYAALPGGLDYGTIVAAAAAAASRPGPLGCSPIISSSGHRGKSLESLEDVPLGYPPSPAPQSQYPSILDWRPRSYDDGDLTPTNDHAIIIENIGGGTLPRPRHCLVRPRPVTKTFFPQIQQITAQQQQQQQQINSQYKSLPRDFDNKYQLTYGHDSSPNLMKRRPPSPPRRQSSRELGSASSINSVNSSSGDIVIDCSGPLPTSNCDDHHMQRLVQPPPPPQPLHHQYQHHHHLQQQHHIMAVAPQQQQQQQQVVVSQTPPPTQISCSPSGQLSRPPSSMSRSWGSVSANVSDEHELIASLALQHRNGSDASFKSSSSTESDSLPFANENAGTIKQRAARAAQEYTNSPSHMAAAAQQQQQQQHHHHHQQQQQNHHHLHHHHHHHHNTSTSSSTSIANTTTSSEPVDVLSDIGNMLTNLTNELDAMLEEEKRQGLNT